MEKTISTLNLEVTAKERLRKIAQIEKRSMSEQVNALIDEAWDIKYKPIADRETSERRKADRRKPE